VVELTRYGIGLDNRSAGEKTLAGFVTMHVQNAGTGKMPVEVAAVAGERFTENGTPAAAYREARQCVVLGAGEAIDVVIDCDFKPDRVLVDPDAVVLQLLRKLAVVRF
jgi:ABC-2 type transport system permease protein